MLIISIASGVALLYIIPAGFISMELGSIILTVTAFLFGIIAGFYIVVTTTDYNSLKLTLATETANWVNLYQNLNIYDGQVAKRAIPLIDRYMRRNFDFELIHYTKVTSEEFSDIEREIRRLPIKPELSSVYEQILNSLNTIMVSRQQLLVLGTHALSTLQWFVLFVLAGAFILTLYGVRSGELFFDATIVAITASTALVLLLVRDLDSYIFNERTFAFDIFENVFAAIGQLPYYPEETLLSGRIHPPEKEYRVGIPHTGVRERHIEVRKIPD